MSFSEDVSLFWAIEVRMYVWRCLCLLSPYSHIQEVTGIVHVMVDGLYIFPPLVPFMKRMVCVPRIILAQTIKNTLHFTVHHQRHLL